LRNTVKGVFDKNIIGWWFSTKFPHTDFFRLLLPLSFTYTFTLPLPYIGFFGLIWLFWFLIKQLVFLVFEPEAKAKKTALADGSNNV